MQFPAGRTPLSAAASTSCSRFFRIALATIVIAQISSCSTTHHFSCEKEGADGEEMQQALEACSFDMSTRAADTILLPFEQRKLLIKCMSGKGYECTSER